MLNLIYDRTAADVENGTAKGYYRHTDMNRVQAAAAYLRGLFAAAGYDRIPSYTLPVWAENDIPKKEQADAYLRAVQALRLFDLPGWPALPSAPDRLDYNGANAIERFLAMTEELYERISGSWFYCDEVFAGEVDV